jgi:zinc protease
VRLASRHDYPLDILGQVLGQGELSRLVQTVRDRQRLVTSISAYNYSMSWGEGFFGIDAVVEPDKMDAAREAILEQVKKIKTIGVTPDELARAKRKTIAGVMYAAQTAHAVGERLADDFLNTGDPDYLKHYAEAIEHVTIADVQAAANEFLDPRKLITVKLTPQTGEAASPMSRPADSPALGQTDYGNQKIELVDLDNERLVNKMTRLDKAQQAARSAQMSQPRMVKLDNGLRVIVQKNTRLPIAAMQWYQLGGLLADEAGREGAANAMMDMMMRGAAGHSADDIARRLEELGAQVSTICGNSTFYVAGQCLSEDWPQVLGIMADMINKPDFPAEEWGKMQPRLLAAIDSMDDNWYMQLRNALRREYFGEQDPWSQPTVGRHEVVAGLTVDQLKQFHADHLSASDSVLAIVGDIDEAKAIAAAKDLFGAMPAQAKVPFKAIEHAPVNSRIAQVVSSKPLVAMQIAYGPGMKRANPDYAPMLVMNEVLDTFPVGWFSQALRGEGPGLVYAVGSGMFTGVSPGYWAVLFNTQPDTASTAMQRALKVVDRIRAETVDADTLNRAREAVLVSEATSHQTNAQLASEAALAELYGLGFKAGDQLIQQIHATTAADVQRVAQQYLQNPLAVILTPEPLDESTLPALK